MTKIVFEGGKTTELGEPKDGVAVFRMAVDEIGTPAELRRIMGEKLSKCEGELQLDRDSFGQLNFIFGRVERDLSLGILHMNATFVSFSMKKKEDLEKDLRKWTLVGREWDPEVACVLGCVELARRLQNTPPNMMMPENFVEEAKRALAGLEGIEIREIAGQDLEKERLALIAAVGRASKHPPRLLIIEYRGAPEGNVVALVGKGVCYDSGGLNIKTGSYMSTMKFDMSGGAVSLGVIRALAMNKCRRNVVVAIPLVENAVSSDSYRPDDVLVCRNGMSIEIENTDAEGRLVLADALAYVADVHKPKEIITIATLTGAIGYALGHKYGGAWATDDVLWERLWMASERGGEWIWRMPLDKYYLKALKKTRVADIRNSAKIGAGGSSRAAMFLKEFTNDLPYIHLDIANIDHCERTGEPTAPLLRTLYFYLYE